MKKNLVKNSVVTTLYTHDKLSTHLIIEQQILFQHKVNSYPAIALTYG